MNPDKERQELEEAGIKFREPTEPVELEDFATALGKAEVLEVTNAPDEPHKMTAEELRLRSEAQELENSRRDELREQRRKQDRAIRSERWEQTVPEVWKTAKLDDLAPNVASACRSWLERPGSKKWTLIFFGPVGVGKSWALHCVARELWIDRYDIETVEAKVLMDLLRPNNEDASAMLERIKTAEVLCLDDIGSEKVTDWTGERLEIILDHRWQHQLATIVTTNIAPADLSSVIGERSASRLVGGATMIKITGKDRRRDG